MKAMSKSQLAAAAGVSIKTFQRWLVRHSEELALLGVKPRDKLLPPVAVKFIVEQYCIDLKTITVRNGQKRTAPLANVVTLQRKPKAE